MELYDVALNQIAEIKTGLFNIFYNLIEDNDYQPKPSLKTSLQKENKQKNSTARSQSNKKEVVITEDQGISRLKQNEAILSSDENKRESFNISTPLRTKTQKKQSSSEKNTPFTPTPKKKNLLQISNTKEKEKESKSKSLIKKKVIKKIDLRMTRSKTIKRTSPRTKLEGLKTIKKLCQRN